MSVFPAGEEWKIAAAGYEATIDEVGAALRRLSYDGVDLLSGYDRTLPNQDCRGQVLAPWPNRLGGGRYEIDEHSHLVPIDEPERGNALHGLVRYQPWRLLEHTTNRVVVTTRLFPQTGWRWVLDLTLEHAVGAGGLSVSATAENVGEGSAPFGFGAHPYLTAGEDRVDELRVTLEADRWCEVDPATMLPIRGTAAASLQPVNGTSYDLRSGAAIGDRRIDTAYTGLPKGWSIIVQGSRTVELWADQSFGWVQIYTGDSIAEPRRRRSGVAVEPLTCPPNAFATGEDLIRLAPGEAWRGSWGLRAR